MERMTTPIEETQEDLDINTKEGLQAFLRYVEDTYSEIIETAKTHLDESIHEKLEQASQTYDSLKEKFATGFSIKEVDGHIDEVLATELQEGYDALLDILDSLGSEEVVLQSQEEEPSVTFIEESPVEVVTPPSPKEESTEAVLVESEQKEEEIQKIPVFSVTPIVEQPPKESAEVVVEESESAPVSEPTVKEVETTTAFTEKSSPAEELEMAEKAEEKLVIDEGEIVEENEITALEDSATTLIERAESLLQKYQEISEVVSSDAVLNVGQHYYKQLAITTERARGVKRNISTHTASKDSKVTELFVEHTKDALDEIADNLDQLDKGLGGFFEKEPEVDLLADTEAGRNQTGSLEVSKDEEGETKAVPIVLAKKPEPVSPPKDEKPVIHNQTVRPISDRLEKVLRGEWGTLIEKVITIPRYKNFIASTFASPVQFEAMLRREIQRIESPSKFDSVFGFTYKSPFNDLLRDMTIKEVVAFDNQPREVIKEKLQELDMKYEVYLDWIDSLNTMLSITHVHPTITFGELFIRAELETLLQHHEAAAA